MELFNWAIQTLRDPSEIVRQGGMPVLMAIIFAETGAMVFFLPGDSLLVVAGVFASNGTLNIWQLIVFLSCMAILGDACSYFIGRRIGPALFNRPRSRLLKPEHMQAAHKFYEKHGGKAIIIARFVPIVRTFVPVVAGVGQMGYSRFAAFNAFGGLGWVASMTLTGYLLGKKFPTIPQHIEKVILVVVVVSLLPAVIEYLRARKESASG